MELVGPIFIPFIEIKSLNIFFQFCYNFHNANLFSKNFNAGMEILWSSYTGKIIKKGQINAHFFLYLTSIVE